jgi:hypothetical protein
MVAMLKNRIPGTLFFSRKWLIMTLKLRIAIVPAKGQIGDRLKRLYSFQSVAAAWVPDNLLV